MQKSLQQQSTINILQDGHSNKKPQPLEHIQTRKNSNKSCHSNKLYQQATLKEQQDSKTTNDNDQQLIKQYLSHQTNCVTNKDITFSKISSNAIVQTSRFSNTIPINNININQEKQIQRRINQAKFKIKFFKLKDVTVYLLDTIERNKTYLRNFAHFLIPYAILLLQAYSVDHNDKSYLIHLFIFVMKKIVQPNISQQITNKQNFEQYLSFFMNYKKVTHNDVMTCLRKFLEREKVLTKTIYPYYYNFFALAYNKEIVFGGEKKENLIQYTVDFKHRFYGEEFEIQNVVAQIQELELLLISKYHNKGL